LVSGDQYRTFIADNDSIFGLADELKAFSVEMKDIKSLLLSVFPNETKELAVVGDFDLESTLQNIRSNGGGVPRQSPSHNSLIEAGIVSFLKQAAEQCFAFHWK
jgi:hypothetical protein